MFGNTEKKMFFFIIRSFKSKEVKVFHIKEALKNSQRKWEKKRFSLWYVSLKANKKIPSG